MQEPFKDEASLLGHIDAVIKLLNNFGAKNKISSQYVIRRLDYLYDRLDDFLEREEEETWDGEVGKATNTKAKMPSCPAEDVKFECGLCKSSIIMYNLDYDLSLALHNQEGVHLQALALQKIKEAKPSLVLVEKEAKPSLVLVEKEAKPSVVLVEKEANKSIGGKFDYVALSDKMATVSLNQQQAEYEHWKYISLIDDRKYYCILCDVYMTSKINASEHLRGNAHQINEQTTTMERTATNRREKEVIIVNGTYWCTICCASLGNSSNAIQHQKGKSHKQKLETKLGPSEEDKFWLKIPAFERDQRIYFRNVGDAVMMCNVCRANVPKTYVNVLGHIRGKSHSRALEMSVGN